MPLYHLCPQHAAFVPAVYSPLLSLSNSLNFPFSCLSHHPSPPSSNAALLHHSVPVHLSFSCTITHNRSHYGITPQWRCVQGRVTLTRSCIRWGKVIGHQCQSLLLDWKREKGKRKRAVQWVGSTSVIKSDTKTDQADVIYHLSGHCQVPGWYQTHVSG